METPIQETKAEAQTETPATAESSNKRERPEEEVEGAKRQKVVLSKNAELRKQLEYYFSDDNMRFDKFFQEKIREDEGWLHSKYILSSPKIKALEAEAADIISCLEGGALLTKTDENGVWIRRETDLPPLEERRNRGDKKKPGMDHHLGGVIFKISGIEEGVAWEAVKEALKEKTPNKRVRFILSHVEEGTTYGIGHSFESDKDFYGSLDLEVGGKKLDVSLVQDTEEAKKVVARLPAAIQRDRSKEMNRKRAANSHKEKSRADKPVKIGGVPFDSMAHLRRSLKEALECIPSGKELVSGPQFNVMTSLLEFHPRGAEKKRDLKLVKVDLFKGEEKSKCFYVVRNDGTSEDFSYLKCLEGLATSLAAEDVKAKEETSANQTEISSPPKVEEAEAQPSKEEPKVEKTVE